MNSGKECNFVTSRALYASTNVTFKLKRVKQNHLVAFQGGDEPPLRTNLTSDNEMKKEMKRVSRYRFPRKEGLVFFERVSDDSYKQTFLPKIDQTDLTGFYDVEEGKLFATAQYFDIDTLMLYKKRSDDQLGSLDVREGLKGQTFKTLN